MEEAGGGLLIEYWSGCLDFWRNSVETGERGEVLGSYHKSDQGSSLLTFILMSYMHYIMQVGIQVTYIQQMQCMHS